MKYIKRYNEELNPSTYISAVAKVQEEFDADKIISIKLVKFN